MSDEEFEELPRLTDERINEIADSMPGGLQGFAKGWGWQQFARAIEDELTPQRRSLREQQDAARYRWLRAWPDKSRDYMTGGVPWVVHVIKETGVPTMQPMYETNLDAAIDGATAQGVRG